MMPGIVGMVRIDAESASVAPMLQKLSHFAGYGAKEITLGAGVAFGVIYRKDRPSEFDWCFDSQAKIGILLDGTMIGADPTPHTLSASDVLSEYQAHAFEHWDRFEGGFVAAIIDVCHARLCIVNDRLGSLPLYYATSPHVFAFAPEAKGIFVNAGFTPGLSTEGMMNFLSAGYCYGDLTLFEGVKALEPSTLLSVRLDTLVTQKKRLWRIVYEPAPELRKRRTAEDALAQAIVEAHQRTLCDGPSHVAVSLSGGWDSRGILAALQQIHRPVDHAQTWGTRDDIPESDACMARLLAKEFGIPYVFASYDTDGFVENAERWCYLSELTTDNLGWFAEGAGFLSTFYHQVTDVILLGDEAWGWRGIVADEMEARSAVFPSVLPPVLRNILRRPFAHDADQMYDHAIVGISQYCENSDFIDRKDFLYLHGRVARFIFSLGYYKELSTPLRRPFLSNVVLEVVRRLPPEHRLWKNLYISTLGHRFPAAMVVPVSSVSSLPNWALDIRRKNGLRRYFRGLLEFTQLEQGPLGQLLARPEFERLRDDFFAADVQPVSRRMPWSRHFSEPLARVTSRSLRLAKALHVLRPAADLRTTSGFDLLRRLALLALLQKQLNAMAQPTVTI
jgi:Glutamine amidotransferase domain